MLGYFLTRSWIGGLIGFIAGGWAVRQFQKGSTGGFGVGKGGVERRKVFFESVFLTMGHLAKVDGRVSEQEIQAARSLMNQWRLAPEEVRVAIELFTRGKQSDFPLDSQMQRLRAACGGQRQLIHAFIEILLDLPLSTGGIKPTEREVLWKVAAGLGISRVKMTEMEAVARARYRFSQQGGGARQPKADLEQAYKALGIEANVSDKDVKTAYRRLMNQHHPDKLVAKGLPESMMEAAKEKTREIRAAYELIRDHRGFK